MKQTIASVVTSLLVGCGPAFVPQPPDMVAFFKQKGSCNAPYTKELRDGDDAKEFGERFCKKYGTGIYVNPCGKDWRVVICDGRDVQETHINPRDCGDRLNYCKDSSVVYNY